MLKQERRTENNYRKCKNVPN